MNQYRTQRLRGGAVVQAGMNATSRHSIDRSLPTRGPYRGVVIRTMVEDSDDRQTSRRKTKVLCDVILVASQIQLQRVQVEQRLGVNDGTPWIPRPSTRRISTGESVVLNRRSSQGSPQPGGDPVSFDDLDGDVVLVDFIEGDIDYPVIRGGLEHERTKRSIVEGDGWVESEAGSERGTMHKNEHYSRHAGVEYRINAAGDVLLDTVGATSDIVEETVGDAGGQVRVRVKNSQRLTVEMDGTDVLEVWKDGGQVRIDLGDGAAQRIPLGDDQVAALKDLADALDSFGNALAMAPPAAPNSALTVASVVTAYGTLAPKLVQVKVDLEAALSDLAKTKKT